LSNKGKYFYLTIALKGTKMSIDNFILLVVISFICYQVGRFIKDHWHESDPELIELKHIRLEKISDMYYVYVGDAFAGQSKNIDELVLNMRDVYKVKMFNLLDNQDNVSDEEYNLFVKSIEKCYTTWQTVL
jgi:hypothetical protein